MKENVFFFFSNCRLLNFSLSLQVLYQTDLFHKCWVGYISPVLKFQKKCESGRRCVIAWSILYNSSLFRWKVEVVLLIHCLFAASNPTRKLVRKTASMHVFFFSLHILSYDTWDFKQWDFYITVHLDTVGGHGILDRVRCSPSGWSSGLSHAKASLGSHS